MASLALPIKAIEVSNPHRYGQKLCASEPAPGAGRVSNPHRYGQKNKHQDRGERGFPVSNPHRYGQKEGGPRGEGPRAGEVSNPHRYGQKPASGETCPQRRQTFQTLIGTVKSRMPGCQPRSRLTFQTLIGTVKREALALTELLIRGPVSNPHRYGQKGGDLLMPLPGVSMFQTLIGTVKSISFTPNTWHQGFRFKPS